MGGISWVLAVFSLGYLFGQATEYFLRDIKRYEIIVMVAITLVGLAVWVLYAVYERRVKPFA